MKKFNLQLAKQGHPLQTRNGRKARIICYDRKSLVCPIVALIDGEEFETAFEYTKDGKRLINVPDELDLFLV